jgi:hypothetical protein
MSLRKCVGIGVCLIGIVVAGCGGGGPPANGGTDPHAQHSKPDAGYPDRLVSGGKMIGGGLAYAPASVMDPQTSGWTVSSGSQNTVVMAGGDARHPSYGLFSILRTSYYVARQRSDDVRVPDSGPVTITKAPLGRKIVDSAQKHGNIEFKSKNGITGTLHLSDDTVTLNP